MVDDDSRPDDSPRSENQTLGEHVKARRAELGMGQRELARATGLSATFIGNLERGNANPTLDTLRKIADALDTPLFRLLVGSVAHTPVVRHNQRRRMVIPPGHIGIELLVPDLLHKMVLFQVRATADDGNLVGPPLMTPTEECIVVVQGRFDICAYGQCYELGPGDSIYLDGRSLESIRVTSEGEASFISTMTPPAF